MFKIYLSAPMTGIVDLNRSLFDGTEAILRAKGYDVVNPLSFGEEGEWLDCIIRDLGALENCDAILLLGGWRSSYGCRIEFLVARKLGLYICHRIEDL